MKKNLIPISSILIPPGEDGRIRDAASLKVAVNNRTGSLLRFGQLQPILVERLAEPKDGKEWKLVDGQTRMVSMLGLTVRHGMGEQDVISSFERWGMEPGMIEATTREDLDPVDALMMEFHANEDRDNFTWEEKGNYVRRIHDMMVKKHGRSEWTAQKTAEYINQSPAFVSQYLTLVDPRNPSTQHERVKNATTKGAALKQLKIVEEQRRRFERVKKEQEASLKMSSKGKTLDHVRAAQLACFHGDSRDWIKKIPSDALAWFHWDPPYGGREGGGGAFAAHEAIQIDHDYATSLMLEMLPEIWRTLQDGAWLVMWYTPVHYNWLRLALQGHRFSVDKGTCHFCGKHVIKDYRWFTENYSCRKSPFRFWVNPYPNYWRKTDRAADGHEIQRFFTKETEPFLLAGKNDQRMPILHRSDRGNVFDFPSVPTTSRRHVNHKPPELLSEILSCISVPGALGGDAGAGSGSILEGAYRSGRKVIVAELDDAHWRNCYTVGMDILKEKNYGPLKIADWLPTSMVETA